MGVPVFFAVALRKVGVPVFVPSDGKNLICGCPSLLRSWWVSPFSPVFATQSFSSRCPRFHSFSLHFWVSWSSGAVFTRGKILFVGVPALSPSSLARREKWVSPFYERGRVMAQCRGNKAGGMSGNCRCGCRKNLICGCAGFPMNLSPSTGRQEAQG